MWMIPHLFDKRDESANRIFAALLDLDWVHVKNVPRAEYYCNDFPFPYSYGVEAHARSYDVQPWTDEILEVRFTLEEQLDTKFEVCFLNRYDNSRNYLGWHADDSPTMDQARPIVTVTFGHERPIEVKDVQTGETERIMLTHGSAFVMHPGMQQTHLHRIPKVGYDVTPRISLTFRGWKNS